MKIAIMQPYFLPYIGYFQLINSVDKFICYDDVNYINKGWINRNNILFNGQKKIFTISLSGASQNKLINEIEISDDFDKFIKTIRLNYFKAPYFNETMEVIEKIKYFDNRNLSLFIKNSLELILDYLNITTELLLSSEIPKDNNLKGQNKILAICKELNATSYINPIGGVELYNKDDFKKEGIRLDFIKASPIVYKQFNNDFVPWLSIIDVLMFNSVAEVNEMLDKYELM